MIDMEICIDQIANMRVEQMNLVLEATRQTVIQRGLRVGGGLVLAVCFPDVPDDAVQIIVHNVAVKIASCTCPSSSVRI